MSLVWAFNYTSKSIIIDTQLHHPQLSHLRPLLYYTLSLPSVLPHSSYPLPLPSPLMYGHQVLIAFLPSFHIVPTLYLSILTVPSVLLLSLLPHSSLSLPLSSPLTYGYLRLIAFLTSTLFSSVTSSSVLLLTIISVLLLSLPPHSSLPLPHSSPLTPGYLVLILFLLHSSFSLSLPSPIMYGHRVLIFFLSRSFLPSSLSSPFTYDHVVLLIIPFFHTPPILYSYHHAYLGILVRIVFIPSTLFLSFISTQSFYLRSSTSSYHSFRQHSSLPLSLAYPVLFYMAIYFL